VAIGSLNTAASSRDVWPQAKSPGEARCAEAASFGGHMDVRIGIAQSPQVIEIELEEGADRDSIKEQVTAALADDDKVLWFTDRKGRDIAVPAERVSFVELGTADVTGRIGFGA